MLSQYEECTKSTLGDKTTHRKLRELGEEAAGTLPGTGGHSVQGQAEQKTLQEEKGTTERAGREKKGVVRSLEARQAGRRLSEAEDEEGGTNDSSHEGVTRT